MEQTAKPRARYAFAITLALVSGGLFIWIIQLARQGEPVGYIILTGLGMLLALLVCGLVLRLLLMAANRSSAQPLNDLKTIYKSSRPCSAAIHPNNLELEPGQMMTAEGFIIDGTAFDSLDED
jgi:hypothetical protein